MTLKLEGISKIFETARHRGGVEEVNLEISKGEGFSLLGPSGCGKTTTLRILGGLEHPDRGHILHNGKDITNLPPQKREIRTVFQKYALFPHLNVKENILFGLRVKKVSNKECEEKVNRVMELLEIGSMRDRPILKLSGGEQQRVALARAIITEPQVLLLDEPLSALDLKLRERMQLELLSLRHKLGSTFIFVTHDQGEAMTLSDRIAVMRAGRIEQVGSPEEIYHRPKTRFVASFIGQANFLDHTQRSALCGSTDQMPALANEKGQWVVRPEHITPRKKGSELGRGFVGMEATILEVAFLGADRLTKFVDDLGRQILVKTPGFEPSVGTHGERLLLSWETEDVWTVCDDR